jgi:hypothetical protein
MKLGERFANPLAHDLIRHHVQPYMLDLGRVSHEIKLGLTPKSF